MKERSSNRQQGPRTGTTDPFPTLEPRTVTLKVEWPTSGTRPGATPTGGLPEQVWEGGKGKSHLDMDLLAEDW